MHACRFVCLLYIVSVNSCMLFLCVLFHVYIRCRILLHVYVFTLYITKTCLYNVDPLKPHFSIVKLGCTGVYIIFLISAQKHRLWVLVKTASSRRF